MHSRVVILLAAIALAASSANASTTSHALARGEAARIRAFETELRELQRLLEIPGLSAAIVSHKRLIWARGFGYADIEAKKPATPTTIYPIASLTKTFAAVLAEQLVASGQLNLDDPMRKYSDDFKDDSVKVRHILTHTSEGTPGHTYHYSGERFWYMTRVLEQCSGKSYRDLLRENILDRVGLADTVPGVEAGNSPRTAALLTRLARPYVLYGAAQIVRAPAPAKDLNASAGILSDVEDLAKFYTAIDDGRLLDAGARTQMRTPAVSDDGRRLPYALGWFVQDYKGTELVWHHGSMPTNSALVLDVPATELTLVLLANSAGLSAPFPKMEADGDVTQSAFASAFLRAFVADENGPLGPLSWRSPPDRFARDVHERMGAQGEGSIACELQARAAIDAWLDGHRAEERREVRVNPAIVAAYVGQYRFDDGYTVTITIGSGHLLSQGPGEEKIELFPASETEFFFKVSDAVVTFVRDEHGNVTGLVTRAHGEAYPARRVERST